MKPSTKSTLRGGAVVVPRKESVSTTALQSSPSLWTPLGYSTATFALCNTIGFVITLLAPKFHFHVDLLGTGAFCACSLLPLLYGPLWLSRIPRIQISALAVAVWSIKLALFLLYRVVALGKDGRFDDLFVTYSVAGFWIISALWGIVCSLPHTLGTTTQAPGSTLWLASGTFLYTMGLAMETLADYQKWIFKYHTHVVTTSSGFCNVGLWSVSQHPNWMGNLLLWTGILVMNAPALVAVSPTRPSRRFGAPSTSLVTQVVQRLWNSRRLFVALLGPLFMWTLFFVQGTGTIMADSLQSTRVKYGYGINADYTHYIDTTPLIVPNLFNPMTWFRSTVSE